MKRISPPHRRLDIEGPVQEAIVNYLRHVLPVGFLVVGVSNNPRSKQTAVKEIRRGLLTGYPDLHILGRDEHDKPCAWFIEVKAPKGVIRDEQHKVHDQIKDIGFRCGVARSIEDVRTLLWRWNVPSKDQTPCALPDRSAA